MTSALHSFPDDIRFELPETFTDPFRYTPHESVRIASEYLIKHIESDEKLAEAFSEGKMLGVLVCTKPSEPEIPYYLAAFSGNVGGNSMIEGFVPPIYDLTNPNGEFKQREAEISQINLQIKEFLEDSTYIALIVQLEDAQKQRDKELENMKAAMAASKSEREKMRKDCIDEMQQASLVRQSQFEKAEFRRLKSSWEEKIARLNILKTEYTDKIDLLRRQRASMSEALQAWIFRQYRVHNSLGEHSSIKDIFESQGLTPPGGTGECAAPKLLEYAYRNARKTQGVYVNLDAAERFSFKVCNTRHSWENEDRYAIAEFYSDVFGLLKPNAEENPLPNTYSWSVKIEKNLTVDELCLQLTGKKTPKGCKLADIFKPTFGGRILNPDDILTDIGRGEVMKAFAQMECALKKN